ncbi:toll/interleukin-1 receptor domain-containing protein [Streptomyces sp. NPDC049687]|uniref:toll/interleukin-1 receptor domain-containing protein n=1 Tax=Streptomyces sp. NPDC049687 TaxID=3365596 RepID=UPI0037908AE9
MTCKEGPVDGCASTRQRVFISHGSAESPYSWEVCEEIREALAEAGYEVFLDRQSLHQQEDWEDQIREELDRCDAAVCVLAREALPRDWPRREAEILRQRHDRQGIFLLVVLLDGVQPQDLAAAGLGVLNIKQALTYAKGTDARPIAVDVVGKFAPLRVLPCEGMAMCAWVERVSQQLGRTDGKVLETAALKLGLERREAHRARIFNGARFLARTLLDAELGDTVPHAVSHLAPSLCGQGPSLAQDLAPTWVKEEAARAFVPDKGAPEGRTILLTARIQKTAEHHIGRAMRQDPARYVDVSLDPLGPDEEGAAIDVLEGLRKALGRLRFRVGEEKWPDPGKNVFVIMPVESRGRRRLAAVVEELRYKAPWLHVVALLEDAPPDDTEQKRWGLEDAVVARPALDYDEELNGHERVLRLNDAVRVEDPYPTPWSTACR